MTNKTGSTMFPSVSEEDPTSDKISDPDEEITLERTIADLESVMTEPSRQDAEDEVKSSEERRICSGQETYDVENHNFIYQINLSIVREQQTKEDHQATGHNEHDGSLADKYVTKFITKSCIGQRLDIKTAIIGNKLSKSDVFHHNETSTFPKSSNMDTQNIQICITPSLSNMNLSKETQSKTSDVGGSKKMTVSMPKMIKNKNEYKKEKNINLQKYRHKCKHCHIFFENYKSLVQHLYEVTRKDKRKELNSDLDNSNTVTSMDISSAKSPSEENNQTNDVSSFILLKSSKFKTLKLKNQCFKLVYCKECQSYMDEKSNQKIEHQQSNCGEINTKQCDKCDLVFTECDFTNHQKLHIQYKMLTLKHFQFTCIQSGIQINPPLPKFLRCSECAIDFHNQHRFKNHKCRKNAFFCETCEILIEQLSFKAHLKFHEYEAKFNLPTSSISDNKLNILYLCIECDIVVDSYDCAVDHAQNHFTHQYKVQTNCCYSCDLTFENLSFLRHMMTTENDQHNNFTKESIKILKFSFTNLAKREWFAMFNGISVSVLEEIALRSIYKMAPQVAMTIAEEGPKEFTLYKCYDCSFCIDPDVVLSHACNSEPCLQIFDPPECMVCKMRFPSKVTRNRHQRNHKYLPSIKYRIVTFYQVINTKGVYRKKKNIKQRLPASVKRQYSDDVTSKNNNNSEKRMKYSNDYCHYYRCEDCDICVKHIKNTEDHSCTFGSNRVLCTECNLHFTRKYFPYHIAVHKNNPERKMKTVPFKTESR